jgi:hypothetical protein
VMEQGQNLPSVSARAHFHPDLTPVSPRILNVRGQQLALS